MITELEKQDAYLGGRFGSGCSLCRNLCCTDFRRHRLRQAMDALGARPKRSGWLSPVFEAVSGWRPKVLQGDRPHAAKHDDGTGSYSDNDVDAYGPFRTFLEAANATGLFHVNEATTKIWVDREFSDHDVAALNAQAAELRRQHEEERRRPKRRRGATFF